MVGVYGIVKFFQKINRFQVLASAQFVRNPFACVPLIVKIKYRGYTIYA